LGLDNYPIKLEVIRPNIGTRIEKAYEGIGFPSDGANIAPFVAVAKCTCECEVIFTRRATMFLTNDVINLAAKVRIVLVNEAVFADALGASYNKSS